MKSTNLVLFTVKVKTYQRNEKLQIKTWKSNQYVQWEFGIWLLHEVFQVTPIDRGIKDFPIKVF